MRPFSSFPINNIPGRFRYGEEPPGFQRFQCCCLPAGRPPTDHVQALTLPAGYRTVTMDVAFAIPFFLPYSHINPFTLSAPPVHTMPLVVVSSPLPGAGPSYAAPRAFPVMFHTEPTGAECLPDWARPSGYPSYSVEGE